MRLFQILTLTFVLALSVFSQTSLKADGAAPIFISASLLQYADRSKGGNIDIDFPAFYVVDQSGKLAYRASGYDKTAPLAAEIDQLLAN